MKSLPLFLLTLLPASSSTFEQVKPILEHSCVECHNADKDKGGLRFDGHAIFLDGGDSGSPVNFEKPAESEMILRVLLPHDDDEFMPPSSKKTQRDPLTLQEIDLLKAWVTAKAPWPEGATLQQREKVVTEDPSQPDPELVSIGVYPGSVTLET